MRAWLLIVTAFLAPLPALAMETTAKQALLIDADTHSVLFEKNADELMHPSSMSKLMTVYVLFERLQTGRIKLDSKFTISEKAWRTQGSKTFVKVGDQISVEDLIHGIIIQSGNDACIVVAEGLSGTEENFVAEMNRIAAKLGLAHSHFSNATGLPDDTHLMSARDLAVLAEHLVKDFPEYYHYFSIPEYSYGGIKQHNRNRLLESDIGVDGLKTGHTDAGGYGITLSAKQGGRRLILVINGLDSEEARLQQGDQLLRYGFREFENVPIAKKGEKLTDIPVWQGDSPTVDLVVVDDLTLTLPISVSGETKFIVRYPAPIQAPVLQYSHIADLVIKTPGYPDQLVPLVSGQPIERNWMIMRLFPLLNYYIFHGQ